MFPRLMTVMLFLSVACNAAWPQDPTKVEPKHYKLAFENEWVQVVNVHYGPHEKSTLHDHPGGVVVILSEGHLKFTDAKGQAHELYAKPGESRWFPPLKHSVENLGDTPYNAVYVGIKTRVGAGKVGSGSGSSTMDDQTRKVLAEVLASIR